MAHCNTIFHQMLKLIPRHHFAKLEAEHTSGRKARSFTRWSQLVHLLSMQLTARVSLRDGKRNNGAPGIDGVTFDAIEAAGLEAFLEGIHREMASGTYLPMRNRRQSIPKD